MKEEKYIWPKRRRFQCVQKRIGTYQFLENSKDSRIGER
jgi:hypothetical protein